MVLQQCKKVIWCNRSTVMLASEQAHSESAKCLCSFPKLSSFTKFTNHWAEGPFTTRFFVIFVGVISFNVLRSMHYWLYHYSRESLRLLTLLQLFINLIFLPLYFCNFIYFYLSSSKIFSIFQYVQQQHNPKNIHWCSSFFTTKPSDIYLVVIFFF